MDNGSILTASLKGGEMVFKSDDLIMKSPADESIEQLKKIKNFRRFSFNQTVAEVREHQ
jgi:hypothetical protein